jgi:hypothetical protein
MPEPSVEPMPLPPRESRTDVPLEAHDASYLAASARISSFLRMSIEWPEERLGIRPGWRH